jgi:hypothetical protein
MRAHLSIALVLFIGGCKIEGDPPRPSRPELKTRIMDRMGRAAVNTALNDVLAGTASKAIARDDYNTSDRDSWPPFVPVIARNLAVYDSLDTNCGNQLLAGTSAAPGRYDALARVLADDRLFLNMDATSCTTYFGVELGVANECGGRTLFYDVIDVTYSALAIGAVSGVSDGIATDEDSHTGEVFPFLAPP